MLDRADFSTVAEALAHLLIEKGLMAWLATVPRTR